MHGRQWAILICLCGPVLAACAASQADAGPVDIDGGASGGSGGFGSEAGIIEGGSGCTEDLWISHSPGLDGIPGTADDEESGAWLYRMDENGHIVSAVEYSDAGADGKWATADDDVAYVQSTTRDAAGRPLRREQHGAPGPDGLWLTADDEITSASDFEYDAQGREAWRTLRGPGSDGVWQTADDTTIMVIEVRHPSDPSTTVEYWYEAPGVDGKWRTSDDVVKLVTRYVKAGAGHVTGWLITSSGNDGVWETPDDGVSQYFEKGCSQHQLHIDRFSGPGLDAAWGTPDDEVTERLWSAGTGCGVACEVLVR